MQKVKKQVAMSPEMLTELKQIAKLYHCSLSTIIGKACNLAIIAQKHLDDEGVLEVISPNTRTRRKITTGFTIRQ